MSKQLVTAVHNVVGSFRIKTKSCECLFDVTSAGTYVRSSCPCTRPDKSKCTFPWFPCNCLHCCRDWAHTCSPLQWSCLADVSAFNKRRPVRQIRTTMSRFTLDNWMVCVIQMVWISRQVLDGRSVVSILSNDGMLMTMKAWWKFFSNPHISVTNRAMGSQVLHTV